MSEIATRPVGTLATFDEKIRAADVLAAASLIPASYKKNPQNIYLAIEMGEALGIHHMVAIQEINVISGRPAPSASLMASLARAAGHTVRVYGDAESATCEIVRADDREFTHKATWDVDKARKSGLWGKGHWAKDPATMLKWRAISECVRFACSEVLGGLKYTPDEIMEIDGVEVHAKPSPAQPAPARAYGIRANMAQPAQAAPEAPVEPQDVPEAEPVPVELLSATLDGLAAAGYESPADVNAAVSGWASARLGADRPDLDSLSIEEIEMLEDELRGFRK